MKDHDKKRPRSNRRVLALTLAPLLVMGGLVAYSPTLYQMFCDLTGFGGTVQAASEEKTETQEETQTARATEGDGTQSTADGDVPTVRITFDANVDSALPWTFRAEQRDVEVPVGETAKVYYYAENNTDETVVARATFNVTPYKAAPYFFKIECFCFTEEKLGPGESARMPLQLYIDEEMLADTNTEMVRDMTLSYTFYRQEDLSREEAEAARDLKAGSQRVEDRLDQAEEVEYRNDAPRQ
ncbi:cytochrome c oxidase assembly protein [Fodinicurvata sediminis]|uniref:cytochrome c oxidase assembly protein n=1 Tax=Fodinicurvata sediminis TaxID=1121832 RepID=UPI0003B32BF4|nr:cytochrome c oxidase assembly protein [Fodinicurvata sediminis]